MGKELRRACRVPMVAATMIQGERDHFREREHLMRAVADRSHLSDPRILAAFREVPRHLFVPPNLESLAYEDRALPLPEGQTISQPTMIAEMLAELAPKPTDRALEVGAGSGYAVALLANLVSEVYAVEVLPRLADGARRVLTTLGQTNAHIVVGDGRRGLPEHAPFDVILVSAFAEKVPDALLEQLADGGRLAMPVGKPDAQELVVVRKTGEGLAFVRRTPCVFVPLVAPS
jgi:protein-L-isoaspartate(D-aspartate) O-methyltransferase